MSGISSSNEQSIDDIEAGISISSNNEAIAARLSDDIIEN